MMAADQSTRAALDSLLSDWHAWCASYRPVTLGYAPRDSTCGDFRTSRQWDDSNGTLDAYVDELTLKATDRQIRALQEPHHTAVVIHARNLGCRVAVWRSPRLPADPDERRAVIDCALDLLTGRLLACGILEGNNDER